jgi:hypothetical protein
VKKTTSQRAGSLLKTPKPCLAVWNWVSREETTSWDSRATLREWRAERAKTDDKIVVKPEMVVRVTEQWGK